jgi:hypothetical protein
MQVPVAKLRDIRDDISKLIVDAQTVTNKATSLKEKINELLER